MMGRGLVLACVAWPGVGKLAIGTAHLESFVGAEPLVNKQVIESRRASLREAALLLEEEAASSNCVGAILVGDMNWQVVGSAAEYCCYFYHRCGCCCC